MVKMLLEDYFKLTILENNYQKKILVIKRNPSTIKIIPAIFFNFCSDMWFANIEEYLAPTNAPTQAIPKKGNEKGS